MFRYSGKEFGQHLIHSLNLKKMEGFVDKSDSYRNVVLTTAKQTRASSIKSVLETFNGMRSRDEDRIVIRPYPFEDEIMTVSRKAGETLQKHWFYKRVLQEKAIGVSGDGSTFYSWEAAVSDAAPRGGAPDKLDKTLKKLAIQMTEKVGGIQDPIMTRAAAARCSAGEGGVDGGAGGGGAEAGGSSSRLVGKRACAQKPKNYREPSESGEPIEESSQPLSQFEGYPDDSGAGYADEQEEEEGDEFDYSDEGGWDGGEYDEEEEEHGAVDFESVAAGGRGVPVNAAAALMGPGEPHPDGTAAAALLSPRRGGGGRGGRWPAGGIGLRLPVAAMARSRQASEEPLSARGEGAGGAGGVGRSPLRQKQVARRLTELEIMERRKRSVAEGLAGLAASAYVSEEERDSEAQRMTEENAAQALEQSRRMALRAHRTLAGTTMAKRRRIANQSEFRREAMEEWARVEQERAQVQQERRFVQGERRRVEASRGSVEEARRAADEARKEADEASREAAEAYRAADEARRAALEERRAAAADAAEERRKVEMERRAMMDEQVQGAMARASGVVMAAAPSAADGAIPAVSGPLWVSASDLERVSGERDTLKRELEDAQRRLGEKEREVFDHARRVEVLQARVEGKDALLAETAKTYEVLRRESADKYNFAFNQLTDAKEAVVKLQAKLFELMAAAMGRSQ